jgi:hypothetical protein
MFYRIHIVRKFDVDKSIQISYLHYFNLEYKRSYTAK